MQGVQSLIFLVLMIGIFYMMLVRPQKRRVEQHRQLVESIDIGDEVVTIGGLFGTVASLDEDEIELEVAPGTRLRFVKSAISRRTTEDVDDEEDELEAGEDG